jgi:SOS-response transcriptional repressor LexA
MSKTTEQIRAEAERQALQKALENAGLRPAAVSEAIGRKKDYIGDYLRGKKDSLKADELSKIKSLIDRASRSLPIKDAGARVGTYGAITVLPVTGFVQAGIWQELDAMDNQVIEPDFTAAPHPRYPLSEQFVLHVRGDSMDAAKPHPIPDGSYVKCVSLAGYGRDPKENQIVVVHRFRHDGGLVESTIKRIRRLPDRIELWPQSTNPRHQPIVLKHAEAGEFEEVKIVAVVLDIIHRAEE